MDNTAKAGTSTTILTMILGNVIQLDKMTQDNIIFWMQFSAFAVSIIVGILTALYYVRKLKKEDQ
ncbi:MAG: hypothetical protein JXR31_10675 [Prolixibacteraceae bacterium]|nr:hypothetical protein [Prolixibacteraceae bacterium]